MQRIAGLARPSQPWMWKDIFLVEEEKGGKHLCIAMCCVLCICWMRVLSRLAFDSVARARPSAARELARAARDCPGTARRLNSVSSNISAVIINHLCLVFPVPCFIKPSEPFTGTQCTCFGGGLRRPCRQCVDTWLRAEQRRPGCRHVSIVHALHSTSVSRAPLLCSLV